MSFSHYHNISPAYIYLGYPGKRNLQGHLVTITRRLIVSDGRMLREPEGTPESTTNGFCLQHKSTLFSEREFVDQVISRRIILQKFIFGSEDLTWQSSWRVLASCEVNSKEEKCFFLLQSEAPLPVCRQYVPVCLSCKLPSACYKVPRARCPLPSASAFRAITELSSTSEIDV